MTGRARVGTQLGSDKRALGVKSMYDSEISNAIWCIGVHCADTELLSRHSRHVRMYKMTSDPKNFLRYCIVVVDKGAGIIRCSMWV